MRSILVIDDDKALCGLLKQYLESDGFNVEIANDGHTGVTMALTGLHAFIILDVMLTGLGGFEVLRRIRGSSDVPILMLTARGADTDRIIGLECGADDYLTKPFNPQELTARIRAIQRRAQPAQSDYASRKVIEIGPVAVDVQGRQVTVDGTEVALTSVEFNLLEILMSLAGGVVSRDRLSKYALGRKLKSYDRSLDIHVSHLRQKLGETVGEQLILTARGVGYVFVVPRAYEAIRQ